MRELLYKIYYTVDGKRDHIIIAGDTIEAVRKTALSIIEERGWDFKVNEITSEKINK